jgi:hypothetical protein
MVFYCICELLVTLINDNINILVFTRNLKVSGRKGLISGIAQGISPGTLLILIKGPLGYQKQQRKKLYPTKQGSTPWLPDYRA